MMQKPFAISLVLMVLTLGGCSKPAPVELQSDSSDAGLEVTSITESDTSLGYASVDSGAVLPEDRVKFAGLLQIAHLTYDGGQQVLDAALAHVLFENRLRPVLVGPRVIGYHGINLGQIELNGNVMQRVEHRLGRRDTSAGVEYYEDMASMHRPLTDYTWTASPDSEVGAFTLSIRTPEDIVVHSPRGGSLVRRDRDLPLSWTGSGNLAFVISLYEPITKKSTPVFKVAVRNNRQRAVLSNKILRLLPPGHLCVFTFVLANRREIDVVARFPGRVLVQATSVYNCYIGLI